MASYRVYCCDSRGKIFSVDDFEAPDDAGSVQRAHKLVNGAAPMFEVWQRERLVFRQSKTVESGTEPQLPSA
jgi:hypothetical protein